MELEVELELEPAELEPVEPEPIELEPEFELELELEPEPIELEPELEGEPELEAEPEPMYDINVWVVCKGSFSIDNITSRGYVRIFNRDGNYITTWDNYRFKNNTISLNKPNGIVINNDFIYLADTYNHRILKMDSNSNVLEIYGGSLDANNNIVYGSKDGSFHYPKNMVLDNDGNMYVIELKAIRKLVIAETVLWNTWSIGISSFGELLPEGITYYNNNIWVSIDSEIPYIAKYNRDGTLLNTWGDSSTLIGKKGSQPLTEYDIVGSKWRNPRALKFDSYGNLYLVLSGQNLDERNSIAKINSNNGDVLSYFTPDGTTAIFYGLAIYNEFLYTSDILGNTIYKFNIDNGSQISIFNNQLDDDIMTVNDPRNIDISVSYKYTKYPLYEPEPEAEPEPEYDNPLLFINYTYSTPLISLSVDSVLEYDGLFNSIQTTLLSSLKKGRNGGG